MLVYFLCKKSSVRKPLLWNTCHSLFYWTLLTLRFWPQGHSIISSYITFSIGNGLGEMERKTHTHTHFTQHTHQMEGSENKGDFNPTAGRTQICPCFRCNQLQRHFLTDVERQFTIEDAGSQEKLSVWSPAHTQDNPNAFHVLFHFLKKHISFIFKQKNPTKQRQQKYSNTFPILRSNPKIPRILSKIAAMFFCDLNRAGLINFLCGACLKTNLEMDGFCDLPLFLPISLSFKAYPKTCEHVTDKISHSGLQDGKGTSQPSAL